MDGLLNTADVMLTVCHSLWLLYKKTKGHMLERRQSWQLFLKIRCGVAGRYWYSRDTMRPLGRTRDEWIRE